jgi:pimeloyl-ACP methyl ester carboxylesterase
VEPEGFEIEVAGVGLAGLAYGEATRPAMVLVHGIRDHAWSLDPIARAFADAYRVWVPHLRGHGDSQKPGSYSMAEFVADLAGLVERFELSRPVLVGHSLGGQIVAQYAGVFDDVPAAVINVEGLGPPRPPEAADPETGRALARRRIRELGAGVPAREPLADVAAAIERFGERNPRLSPERMRLLVERGVEPHPAGGVRWKWAPEASRVWGTVSPDEMERYWSWIRCPVQIVTASGSAAYWARAGLASGLDPERFTAELERKLSRFADAESVAIDEAGHMVHYDQPDALVRVMRDFLERRLERAAGAGAGVAAR